MRSVPIRTCLLVLGAGLLLAACGQQAGSGAGKGQPAPAAAAAPDACLLLTPEDVRPVTSDVSGSLSSTLADAVGRDRSQCVYSVGSEVPPKVISLQVRQAESAERAATLHRAAESGLASLAGGTQAMSGLGDGAFWVGGKLDQLHVLAGNLQLIFTVQVDKDAQAAARTLAGKALARLKAAAPAPPGPSRR